MRGRRPYRQAGRGSNSSESGESRRKLDSGAARNVAVGLLARREHAQAEVKRKLRDRGFDDDTVSEVIDDLTRQRLLSDDRFAEAFIRSRADRGQGPVRLKAELRQLKIPAELIEKHLAAAEVPWNRMAAEVRLRKFGQSVPTALGERAKQVRFLQYRGFTADQIRAALGSAVEDDLLEEVDGDPPDSDDTI